MTKIVYSYKLEYDVEILKEKIREGLNYISQVTFKMFTKNFYAELKNVLNWVIFMMININKLKFYFY